MSRLADGQWHLTLGPLVKSQTRMWRGNVTVIIFSSPW